jgi:hypothetical protein
MDQLISARWATDKEVSDFWEWASKKNKSKNDFTNKWLSHNGEQFIKLHEAFPGDMFEHKKRMYQEKKVQRLAAFEQKVIEYNNRKENLQKCLCSADETIRIGSDYELIGCTKWMDFSQDHTKIYKPKWYEGNDLDDQFIFEASTNYISQLRDFYKLPKELKSSILIEFLLMNNIDLLNAEAKEAQSVGSKASKDSTNREKLVKSILEKKGDKLGYQKMIKATFKYGGYSTLRTDFILTKGANLYLIEQKKREDLISEEQINIYLQCLKYLAGKYNIFYLVIVEFGDTNLEKNIINFKDLSTYEFI